MIALETRIRDPRTELRAATRHHHEQLEGHPLLARMMGPACDRLTLQRVIAAHLGFYRAMEPSLWQRQPRCLRHHAGFRFREPLARADLRCLDGDDRLVPKAPVPSFHGNADWAGYLYVIEGASLGGGQITAHIGRLDRKLSIPTLQTFAPYGDHPGRVWTTFVGILRTHLTGEAERARSIAAARRTFAAFGTFLTRAQEIGHDRRRHPLPGRPDGLREGADSPDRGGAAPRLLLRHSP